MSSHRIVYTPLPETTRKAETDVLMSVYRFVLDCLGQKKGGPATAPDDAKEIKNVRAAEKYTR